MKRTSEHDLAGKSFLFTGKLASMTRTQAQARVKRVGGSVASSVSKDLGVLVIGDEGSALYGDGDKGAKQLKAESLNAKGSQIQIISEASFLALCDGAASMTASDPPIPVTMPLSLPMTMMPMSMTTSPPRLTLVTKPDSSAMSALCGGTVDGDTLYLVGGLGKSLILRSNDGEKFSPVKAPGRGLRGIVVDGDTVWLCGEYGTLFRSRSGFDAFEPVPTGAQSCLHGLARDVEGAIWVGGDGGFLRRSTDGETFEPVTGIPKTVCKMRATPDGVLIPSGAGLWRARGATIEQLGLTKSVNQAIVTRDGTILAAGAKNKIYRSTDGGAKFRAAKLPEFQPTELPEGTQFDKPYWVKPTEDINLLAQLADGRIVAVGDCGVILVSGDDGQRFERVEHELYDGSFWAAGMLGTQVFFGGGNKVVLRVDP